jgi:hypothetical protein
MTRVIQGERQHHKGWRLAETGAFRRKAYAIEKYLKAVPFVGVSHD